MKPRVKAESRTSVQSTKQATTGGQREETAPRFCFPSATLLAPFNPAWMSTEKGLSLLLTFHLMCLSGNGSSSQWAAAGLPQGPPAGRLPPTAADRFPCIWVSGPTRQNIAYIPVGTDASCLCISGLILLITSDYFCILFFIFLFYL